MYDRERIARGMGIKDRYELVALVARGTRGELWRGARCGAGGFARPVAIKIISPDCVGDPIAIAQFFGRARISAELRHPNIVQIEDLYRDRSRSYHLVMEWVDGISLRNYLDNLDRVGAPPSWDAVAAIGLSVLKGLSAAHSRVDQDGTWTPVLHGELTPDRILIGVDGVAKVTGFGMLGAPNPVDRIIGYQAPEAALGTDPGEAADIFSVGAMLWEAVVGRPLFGGDATRPAAFHAGRWMPPSLATVRPDLPERLALIIDRALAHCADHRFTTADEMVVELEQLLGPSWSSARVELERSVAVAQSASSPERRSSDSQSALEVSESDIILGAASEGTAGPTDHEIPEEEPYVSVEIRGGHDGGRGRPAHVDRR